MGISSLSWQELSAFCDNSCYHLTNWEREQIINMSRSYVGMYHEAKELNCLSPMLKKMKLSKREYVQMMSKGLDKQMDAFVNSVDVKKG